MAETDADERSTVQVDQRIDAAERPESNPGSSVQRSPLGREVSMVTASRVWWGVLVFAVLSVGVLQQRVDAYQAFQRDRYLVALVLSSLVAAVVWAGLRFLLRLGSFQSIAATAVFVLLFFRWHLLLTLSSQLRLGGIVADLFVVVVAAIMATVLLSRSRHLLVIGGAVLMAVGGFLIAISSYLSWMFIDTAPMAFVEIAPQIVTEGDVAVILLDAYLREDQLLELMDFDNSDSDCCDHEQPGSSDSCDPLMHCGAAPAGVAVLDAGLDSRAVPVSGLLPSFKNRPLSPSFDSPLYRPPIS